MLRYIVLIFLSSCTLLQNSKGEQVVGVYELNPGYGVWNSLELKSDSTFLFQWRTGLIGGETLGKWGLSKNKLILNSDRQIEINPAHYKLVKAERIESDSITIEVWTAQDSLPSFFSTVCVKKDSITSCKNNGLEALPVSFGQNEPDSIIIDVFSLKKVRYKTLNKKFNSYVFMLESYDNSFYRYFKDKEFIFRKNRLYDDNLKRNKYIKKKYYEKL